MKIMEKIANLKKSIKRTDELVNKLISNLQSQKLKVQYKEKKILYLKAEVRNNIDKIDKIIEDYNANS